MTTYSATYSPEDNKLRLCASSRLDPDLYAGVRAAGFIWAPKQGIFVAPMWTPEREDFLRFHEVTLATVLPPDRAQTVDFAHPALQVFTGEGREGLLGTRTWRYMLLKPGERDGPGAAEGKVLISFDDGAPALVEARRGRGKVMLFTSTVDREWSDWTIRTSFLPALQRLVGWLAGALEERRDAPSLVGTPRVVPLFEGQKLRALVGPDGRERGPDSLAAPGGDSGPPALVPDRPGLWQVKVEEGGQERLEPRLAFAVLPDPREADTTRLDPQELTAWFGGASHAKVAAEGAPRGDRPVPLWSILLVLALAAFLGEGLLIA